MPDLHISLACGDYDRTRPLRDGTICAEGLNITYLASTPPDIFWRMIRHQEFDVAEMSLSAHVMGTAAGDWPFVAVPVFPSRMFRHAFIFVHERADIQEPSDLRGRRIGVPEYHMTAALFARGMLSDEFGVRSEDVRWVQGGLRRPGRKERMRLDLPGEVELTVERERTIDDMLVAGDLDALITAEEPPSFLRGEPGVRRLFDDPGTTERQYFRRTGIFPIMHTLAVRRELLDTHPWMALSLFNAFSQAKGVCLARMTEGDGGALPVMLPFLRHELESARAEMGHDYWPYGVAANRKVLEAAARYSEEQGLSKRRLAVDELFAASTLDESLE